MSEEDDLESLLNDISSSDDEASGSSDNDESGGEDAAVEEFHMETVSIEEITMSSDDDSESYSDGDTAITQAEVYENLKRIGELEDEKQGIQDELKRRTAQLRGMLKHIDRGSMLYKMLVSALPSHDSHSGSTRAPKSAPKAASENKKSHTKKAVAPAVKAPAPKKAAKKKTVKKKARRK